MNAIECARLRTADLGDSGMNIDVYGPGCANCRRLEQQTKEALTNIGLDVEVRKVEDVVAIADASNSSFAMVDVAGGSVRAALGWPGVAAVPLVGVFGNQAHHLGT